MKRTAIKMAFALAFGAAAVGAQAATLNAGDKLVIAPGSGITYDAYGNVTNVASGTWFGMDTDGNLKIAGTEKTPVFTTGGGALVVGTTQAAGTFDTWSFFGQPGTDKTTVAVSGSTSGGLNLSGWTVFWGGGDIPMTGGSWTPGNAAALGAPTSGYSDGLGIFNWDGVYGHSFEVWYTATVPSGASCCVGVKYLLHMAGTVQAVPVPAAAWLFGSGLLGLVGIARRKKNA